LVYLEQLLRHKMFKVSYMYTVIKKSLCTWWLQYRKLQVMFSVPCQFADIYWHAELYCTVQSVSPNSDYIIMVGDDWYCPTELPLHVHLGLELAGPLCATI
jgi:hypothetical protein